MLAISRRNHIRDRRGQFITRFSVKKMSFLNLIIIYAYSFIFIVVVKIT